MTLQEVIETGVALGTFSLAFVTWRMAKATKKMAGASEDQLQLLRRQSEEARQPDLHAESTFIDGWGGRKTLGISINNAGGGLAKKVGFVLMVDEEYAFGWPADGFLRPGESLSFGTELRATDEGRGVVYCRGQDERDYFWNLDGEPRSRERGEKFPGAEEIIRTFYPDTDFASLRQVVSRRGSSGA